MLPEHGQRRKHSYVVSWLPVLLSADKGVYQRVGEATELALRVLAEKIGLPGYAQMPAALDTLDRQARATFCNDFWQKQYTKVRAGCLCSKQCIEAIGVHW